jgi:hypothetical protein
VKVRYDEGVVNRIGPSRASASARVLAKRRQGCGQARHRAAKLGMPWVPTRSTSGRQHGRMRHHEYPLGPAWS